ncbi:hypothetical protein BMF89_19495 [Arthrobacter sp. SRS-W-1-2016]|nr:hypothetical protein BMF89_19495 [Arthrobacter sp. SRS-W-1-2016]
MFLREPELTGIIAHCEASETALTVMGETGSGKSALVSEAERRWVNTVSVRVNPLESQRAYSGLISVLSGFPDPRWRQLTLAIGSAPESDPFAIALRIVTLLPETDNVPLVLMIDDADLLDPESRAVIGFVTRRLAGTGLRLVLFVRVLPHDGSFAGLPSIELKRFERARVHSLVTHAAGSYVHTAVVDVITAASSGIPARAIELVHGLGTNELAGKAPLALPLRFSGSIAKPIQERIGTLSALKTKLLRLIAASQRTLVADASRHDDGAALVELIERRLVARSGEWLCVSDPAVRSVAYHSIDARGRLDLHAQAASDSHDTFSKLWHESFVTATTGTASGLRSAALELIRDGRDEIAFEFTERSLLLRAPNDGDVGELLELASAYFYAGHVGAARRYVDMAEQIDPASAAARLLIASLRVRMEYMTSQTLLTTLAEDALERHADSAPDEASLLIALLAIYSAERWELAEADKFLDRIVEPAAAIGNVARTVIDSARILNDAMSGRAQPPCATVIASDAAGSATSTTALLTRARALTYAERYDEARDIFRMILSSAAGIEPLWVTTTRLYSIDNDRLAGDIHGAIQSVRILLRGDDAPSTHQPYRLFHEYWYLCETGDTVAAEASLDRLYAACRGRRNPAISARVDAYLGARELHRGDLASATRLLMRSRVICAGVPNPHLYRSDADLVESLVRSGDRTTARAILEDVERRSSMATSRWSLLAIARCRALLADDSEVVVAFERVLAQFGAGDSDYEYARTLSAYAVRLEAVHMTSEAIHARHSAASTFRRLGLAWWAETLDASPVDASQTAGLSESEQEVVDLVVAGRRNREIASALFISVRAVEARLTTIYRKLGVSSRAQLVASVANPAPGCPRVM